MSQATKELQLNRRDFLKFGGLGMTAIAIGGVGGWSMFAPGSVAMAASGTPLNLTMVEVQAEMIDGILVPMWSYSSDLITHHPARIPGPTIFAFEGDELIINVNNQIPNGGRHSFTIPGVTTTAAIPYNRSRTVTFTVPAAGTYMYFDSLNRSVNRVMGLHGALVVLPRPETSNTPYSNPTANIQLLFDDFGTTDHFPGQPWDPNRNTVWIFNTVDPNRNIEAFNHPTGIDPAVFAAAAGPNRYLPQYFTINGASGFFGAQHAHGGEDHTVHNSPDAQMHISVRGRIGQPCVIRTLNAGLMWHSPHIHGNHVYVLTQNGRQQKILQMVDTWSMPPFSRTDVLLPFIAPPDIPPNFWERAASGDNDELFPLMYPMHDHNEISNTAAGGNYPHGLATHWQIDGPLLLEPDQH